MDEEGNNFTQEGGQSAGDGQERIADDALPLCSNCLKPCHPLQNYCHGCGSNQVINPLASYMPFVNIRFNYGGLLIMWRKIWYRKDTRLVSRVFCLLVVAVLAPMLLVIGPGLQKGAAAILVIVGLVLLLGLCLLWFG